MRELSEYHQIIENAILGIDYADYPAGLIDPIKYTLASGGKRLRPVLTLATCEAFGTVAETAVNQALGVEMFHNFTLLHDDVMDLSDTRRGQPTVHVKWDIRTAILSGDAMLTLANRLVDTGCSPDKMEKINRLTNRTAMEIYAGQQLDMDFESRRDVTVDEYLEMIRLKTSVLLGCACSLGAIMAGASDEDNALIYRYGELMGLAFQLRDDYLDTYGDPLTFGKDIGGDIVNNKKTWLYINALHEDTSGTIMREMTQPSEPTVKIDAVRRVYSILNLPERCCRLIEEYTDQALEALNKVKISPAANEFFTRLALGARTRTN